MRKSLAICVYVNTAIAVALSLYFFLIPAGELIWDLRDPGLRGEQIPRFAFRWHQVLSPKYETWAPQLWPQTAQDWYAKYERQFWQEGLFFAGFREFPRDINIGWFNMSDVDAGPVIGGYGVAASIRKLRRWRRQDSRWYVPWPQFQVLMWWILLGCAVVMGVAFRVWIAVVFLLAAMILPSQRRHRTDAAAKQNPSSEPVA